MTHVPANRPKKSRGLKASSRRFSPLPDGKVVAKMFNPVATRPYPALVSLEQGLTVTLNQTVGLVISSTTLPVYASSAFNLSQFGSASQYTSLFDQYRFEEIEVWIEPLNDSTAVSSTAFVSAIDLDDATTPASFQEVADRQGSLSGTTLSGHYHRWKPHMAVALYSGVFTSFGNEVADWIDVGSPSVQHYGLKVATFGPDGIARTLQMTYRARISFRGPAI